METPQLENGYTRIANELLEQLGKINLSAYQTRVLFCIIRKTYGYGKKDDWVSVSQIVEMTGIHKAHISRTKKELLQRKIVTSSGNKIGIQKDFSLWVELPRQVTVTSSGNTKKVTNLGLKLPNQVQKLPVQADTKENNKRNYTKEILPKGNTAFGNAEINLLITTLKEKMGIPTLDQSVKSNRQYSNLLIKKCGNDVYKAIKVIIVASQDPWWKNHITSMKDVYYNAVKIVATKRGGGYVDATNIK